MNNWETYIKRTERLYASVVYSYGFDKESAEDIIYQAYLSILEHKYEPTVALGYTIIKNQCKNMHRNRYRRPIIYNEHFLPVYDWHEHGEEVLLDDIASQDIPIVAPIDFDEVMECMQEDLHPDDYVLIMLRAYGYSGEYLQNKFHLSRYQVQQRLRVIRKYLNYKFPALFEQL